MEQPSFYNVFIMCCCYKSSEVLIKMFSSWFFVFSSQIFSNDINHGYRAAILKKNPLWRLLFFMAVMKRCAERCALQLYCTSLIYFWALLLKQRMSLTQSNVIIIMRYSEHSTAGLNSRKQDDTKNETHWNKESWHLKSLKNQETVTHICLEWTLVVWS